jgi:hypothetical protein
MIAERFLRNEIVLKDYRKVDVKEKFRNILGENYFG